MWMGFGGPKPPIPVLSQDASDCVNFNATDPTPTTEPQDYFPLYQVSYTWNGPYGFAVTVLVAQIVSRIVIIFEKCVGRVCHQFDPKLLSPLFPNIFRSSRHLFFQSAEELVVKVIGCPFHLSFITFMD